MIHICTSNAVDQHTINMLLKKIRAWSHQTMCIEWDPSNANSLNSFNDVAIHTGISFSREFKNINHPHFFAKIFLPKTVNQKERARITITIKNFPLLSSVDIVYYKGHRLGYFIISDIYKDDIFRPFFFVVNQIHKIIYN